MYRVVDEKLLSDRHTKIHTNNIKIIFVSVSCAGATDNDNDCRTTIACGISGSEPLASPAFCSKPEDEMEKLSHRTSSSLGVVSVFFFRF